ncbi:MAG: YceD family protein [Chitinivibrionales bacterium]
MEQDVLFDEEQAKAGEFKGPVACRAEVDRMQGQIVLQISFGVRIRLECARCLTGFEQRIAGNFSALAQHRSSAGDKGAEDSEADACYTDEDDEIDLRQAVYDEVMTAISLMPLCSPDCPGMDVKKQEEPDEAIDPRWEKLKKLRGKKE